MLTPAYQLTIGGQRVDTTGEPQASTLIELDVLLDLNVPIDVCRLTLGRVGSLEPELDDEATIKLGYDDDDSLTTVITGVVSDVRHGLTQDHIVISSPAIHLLHHFTDRTFEEVDTGDIIRALADESGVDIANSEAGINYPAYVVHSRRSFYHHIRDLAELSGFDVYFNQDGELVVEEFTGGRVVHVFEYSKHIVALDVQHLPPEVARVETFGESAGSANGTDSWAWLTKDFSPLRGASGNGEPVALLERSALRTSEAAQSAAQAAFTDITRRKQVGRLCVVGRAQVRLGDSVRLTDVPRDDLNRSYQVRDVQHHIDKHQGFTTLIGIRSTDTGRTLI